MREKMMDNSGSVGKKALVLLALAIVLLVGWAAFGVSGSAQAQDQGGPPFKLLIVDETRTFAISMRVELLARALKRTGLFDLSAKVVEVESSFVDPLQGLEPDQRYDLILIVPRGLDDWTVRQLWLVTRPFNEVSPGLIQAVGVVKGLVAQVSQGLTAAVDVTEDAIPGIFATIFIRKGWL